MANMKNKTELSSAEGGKGGSIDSRGREELTQKTHAFNT